jgi:hypothetical protein
MGNPKKQMLGLVVVLLVAGAIVVLMRSLNRILMSIALT